MFEGEYHLGFAALVNSLCRSGFNGHIVAGYRGGLPSWIRHLGVPTATGEPVEVAPGLVVTMLPLTTDMHLTWYKPTFMLNVLQLVDDADCVAYFDPDIVVKAPWTAARLFFTTAAVSLVEDVNAYMPYRHPKRLGWDYFFSSHGIAKVRQLDRYFNAGFVGVGRDAMEFLRAWQETCEVVLEYHDSAGGLRSGGPADLFESSDQDALNYCLSATTFSLNTAGPDAMDFDSGGHYFSHAIGQPKPWNHGYIARALRGVPPNAAHKAYLEYADFPVAPFSPSRIVYLKYSARLAAGIGRFYRRG